MRWLAAPLLLAASLILSPVAAAGPPYSSCADAAQDGRTNIPKGDPAYSSKLDRDGDGIACEAG